jgi:glycosyltransferase involved in cell wall biosynthesis
MPGGRTELSIVVPVYGCAECLEPLHSRLRSTLEGIGGDFELIFVDDRSPDGAWEVLRELASRDPAVRAIRLSRNFGQHAAITAGLAESRGRWTVVMDCDLQEPPEAISRLYAKAREGYDIVHTRRVDRPSRSRRLLGGAYFRLRNFFLGTRTGVDQGTLSILSRKVVEAFLQLRDQHREYLIALDWLGYHHATIEFDAAKRHAGASSYTPRRLLRVAVDGMFFQTTVLLRWIVAVGFAVTAAGLALAAYYLYVYFTSDPLPGYTSLAVLILVLAGFVIASLGVIGLYVGKVFEQVKGRPLFVVDARTPERDAPELSAAGEPSEEPAGVRR